MNSTSPSPAHLGVYDEVQVSLPVALFLVREPLELVWQRQQRLGQHGPLGHVEGQLALVRALHAGEQ